MHSAYEVGGGSHTSELVRNSRLRRLEDRKSQEASETTKPVASVSPFNRSTTILEARPHLSVEDSSPTFVEMARSSPEYNDRLEKMQSRPIKCRAVKKVAVAALAVTCSVLAEIGLLILSPFLGAFFLARMCPCIVFLGRGDDEAAFVFLVIMGVLLAIASLPFAVMSYVGAGIVFGKVMGHFPNLYPDAADCCFVRHCNKMYDDIEDV